MGRDRGNGSGGVHGLGVDPVQLSQAMKINELTAALKMAGDRLNASAMMLRKLQAQLRMNETALAYLLALHYPQETFDTPNLIREQEDVLKAVADQGYGVQISDDYEFEGRKVFAYFALTSPEAYSAAIERFKKLMPEQAKAIEEGPSPIILPPGSSEA